MRRTDMQNIRDILTLRYELGLSFARISGALGVCRGTVSNVSTADEAWLRAAVYPPRERPLDGLWQALDVERITAAGLGELLRGRKAHGSNPCCAQ